MDKFRVSDYNGGLNKGLFMAENYFQVLLSNVSSEEEDLLTEMCFSYGAGGMSENLKFSQDEETYEPITVESSIKEISVFFEQVPAEDFFLQLEAKFSNVQFSVNEEKNRDWMEEWKKGYESFELCEGYWVVPSWLEPPAAAQTILRVDPGMAFGTGTHDTTQVASSLLVNHWDFGSVLDVGTGTGILAMLSHKLGATHVAGTEIDVDARRVARENCTHNKMLDIEIYEHQVEQITQPTDWVIANIIDGVLVRIQNDLLRLAQRRLLVTGILEEREAQFLVKFKFNEDFQIIERRQQGEWVGFLMERKL